MEHLLQKSKCSIFHNSFKYIIFQRRQKALLWSNSLITLICLPTEELWWSGSLKLRRCQSYDPMSYTQYSQPQVMKFKSHKELPWQDNIKMWVTVFPLYLYGQCSNFSSYNRKEATCFQCIEIEPLQHKSPATWHQKCLNFHLGRYIVGYTVWNLVLRWCGSGTVKRDFRRYIRQYTSPN